MSQQFKGLNLGKTGELMSGKKREKLQGSQSGVWE